MPEASSKLRVMRIVTRLNVGGPSYQAIYLTQRLQDARFETRLLVGSVGADEGSMEPLAQERGVPFTRVPGLGREISLKTDGLTLFRLWREIRKYRPHIVHTHLAKAGTLGRIAARMAGVPAVVHTYHGHVFHGYFSRRKTELFLRIERALARRTDRIIVLGEAQEEEILSFGVGRREQMRRIPLGLELEPFLNAEDRRGAFLNSLGVREGGPVVGIVARLVPIKAHDLFLEAARKVADQHPDALFLIIGDGELRGSLEERAKALGFLSHGGTPNAEDRLLFTGFQHDLPAVYADLDVVVLCSRNEGLPVTLIEALAAARPVVSTEVGAVRDLVRNNDTGLMVPAGDADALAAAILRQLEHPDEAARMGARGREHVYPRFSIDRLEADIRALYTDLMPHPAR